MPRTDTGREEARSFYREALQELEASGIPYMLGGGWAMVHYTGIHRDTKDVDVFCRSVDHPAILKHFADRGHTVQLYDVRWLAKILRGDHYIDVIWDTVNNICRVDDDWLRRSTEGEMLEERVRFIPPEELLWCKMYVMNRERFDGADVNHLLLKQGAALDWDLIKRRMDPHWHILLSHLLLFQFCYPSDYRTIVPEALFTDLLQRAQLQLELPPPMERVCRGPLIDQTQYAVDIREWNYKTTTIKTV